MGNLAHRLVGFQEIRGVNLRHLSAPQHQADVTEDGRKHDVQRNLQVGSCQVLVEGIAGQLGDPQADDQAQGAAQDGFEGNALDEVFQAQGEEGHRHAGGRTYPAGPPVVVEREEYFEATR